MLCLFYLICSGYNISCFVPSYVPGISIHIPVSGSHFRICSGLRVSRPDLRLRGESFAPAYYHRFMTPSGRGIYSSVPRTRAYLADGKGNLVVSTSCSLLHTAVDFVDEAKLDKEINLWLVFA